MKNIKLEKNLVGSEWWKSTFAVPVEGDPNAAELPKGLAQEEKEKIIQSWTTVAVLEVKGSVSPLLGFMSKNYVGMLKEPLQTDEGKFGVRIGREAVWFFILDKNLETEPSLKLLEITTIENPQYNELPLY